MDNTSTMIRSAVSADLGQQPEVSVVGPDVMMFDGVELRVEDGALVVEGHDWAHAFHAMWLRERSTEPGDVDSANGQRLVEPTDIAVGVGVARARFVEAGSPHDRTIEVLDTSGHVVHLRLATLLEAAGRRTSPDLLPNPEPWSDPVDAVRITWDEVLGGRAEAMYDVVDGFHRLGWFVITGTPTAPGSLHEIASHFGRVSPTSFGDLFDVVSQPDGIDLAYTPVALSAHTDQPYRRPTPGLQFLHVLQNDAAGGASTVVDGLAAVEALRRHDPAWFELLTTLAIEFRYDIGSDVVVGHAPIIDVDSTGALRQFRFSPRLDFAPAVDIDVLDAYYSARRWLAEWLADPRHCVEFKMDAGDVLVVDNHRVLHGRTAFDVTNGGHRHLQGCYIDHDGPATMWRLLRRRLVASGAVAGDEIGAR